MQVGKQKPTNWSAKALLPWAHNALYWWNMHFPFMAAHSNLYVMFNVNVNKCTKTPSWMLLLNSLQELLFMMYIPDFCNLSLLRTQDRFPLNSSSLSFGLYKSALFLDLFFFLAFFFFFGLFNIFPDMVKCWCAFLDAAKTCMFLLVFLSLWSDLQVWLSLVHHPKANAIQ